MYYICLKKSIHFLKIYGFYKKLKFWLKEINIYIKYNKVFIRYYKKFIFSNKIKYDI